MLRTTIADPGWMADVRATGRLRMVNNEGHISPKSDASTRTKDKPVDKPDRDLSRVAVIGSPSNPADLTSPLRHMGFLPAASRLLQTMIKPFRRWRGMVGTFSATRSDGLARRPVERKKQGRSGQAPTVRYPWREGAALSDDISRLCHHCFRCRTLGNSESGTVRAVPVDSS